jgi:uncharacterized membrane protein YdjX (TVP38/TMEM64 family)
MSDHEAGTPAKRASVLVSPASVLSGLLLIGAIVAVVLVNHYSDYNLFSSAGFKQFAKNVGWLGPTVFICLLALTVVVSQLPGVPLAVGAGMLWGVWPGFLFSLAGGFVGGMVAYGIGRGLGREAVYTLTGKRVTFREGVGTRVAGVFIGVTRLVPILPFDIISYAAGISGVPFLAYAAATLVGMAPSSLLIVYMGSTLMLSIPAALGVSVAAALVIVVGPILLHRSTRFDLERYVTWK